MPVILKPADWSVWLGEVPGDPPALLRPAAEGGLKLWPVGREVGAVRNEGRAKSPMAKGLARFRRQSTRLSLNHRAELGRRLRERSRLSVIGVFMSDEWVTEQRQRLKVERKRDWQRRWYLGSVVAAWIAATTILLALFGYAISIALERVM